MLHVTDLSQVCSCANIMEKAHVQLEICAMFLTATQHLLRPEILLYQVNAVLLQKGIAPTIGLDAPFIFWS